MILPARTSTRLAVLFGVWLGGCTEPEAVDPCAFDPPHGAWSFDAVHHCVGIDVFHQDEGRKVAIMTGGVAVGDVDDDGWDDIVALLGSEGLALLSNQADGTFSTPQPLETLLPTPHPSGPTLLDLDADGDLDLIVGGVDGSPTRVLHNDGDGGFTDATEGSGLEGSVGVISIAAADIDEDGDLDLATTHWVADPIATRLWRKDPEGFVDATEAWGLGTNPYGFTPNFADLDGDGALDLLIAADFSSSRVWVQREGRFVNKTSLVIDDEAGMGAAVGDIDGDGDLDWFVTSAYEPESGLTGNRLYINQGDASFVDVSHSAGVRDGGWGWAACMEDLDNDGLLDLAHVNGTGRDSFASDQVRLYQNLGAGRFANRADELGVQDRGQGRGLVCFDYDHDGDLDLLIMNRNGELKLYRNAAPSDHHFFAVQLHSALPNRRGIGAHVEIQQGDRRQLRHIQRGSNYVSQNPARAHFGLGTDPTPVSITVRWPSGDTTHIPAQPVDQRIRVAVSGLVAP